jgi:hypothetical protein
MRSKEKISRMTSKRIRRFWSGTAKVCCRFPLHLPADVVNIIVNGLTLGAVRVVFSMICETCAASV